MAKMLDTRLVNDIEVIQISYKYNVEINKLDEYGDPIPIGEHTLEYEKKYVVLVRIVYNLFDSNSSKLRRVVRNHELYPLDNKITSIQFINNIEVLAPLVRAAAISDRAYFTEV